MKYFMVPWAEKVEKESKGRIKVQIYPSMQLGGKATQLLQQVRDGVVDVAWTLPGFTPGVMPKLEIFELPFLHRSTQATVMALQDYVPKYMAHGAGERQCRQSSCHDVSSRTVLSVYCEI